MLDQLYFNLSQHDNLNHSSPLPLRKILSLSTVFLLFVFLLPSFTYASSFSTNRQLLSNGNFETNEAWLPYQRGFTFDSKIKKSGHRSLKLKNHSRQQRSGAYQQITLNQTEVLPLTLTGYVKGRRIKNSHSGYFGASLYVEIKLTDNSIVYWNSVANLGTFRWRHIAINIGNLPQITQPVKSIDVYAILADASGVAWFDNLQLTEYRGSQAAVTFIFDDGEDNTLSTAKPILDQHHFKATAAIPIENIQQPGFLTKNQIRQLHASGWEIMAHGYSHQDFSQMPPPRLRWELKYPKRYFSRLGIPVYNVAYPYGAYSGSVIQKTSRYYRSGRAYEIGSNQAGSWPFDIKVRSLESNTGVDQVRSWIEDAQKLNRWVVIVGHRIASSGDDQYFTTPEKLTEIINYIAATGIPVVTYNQGLDLFAL